MGGEIQKQYLNYKIMADRNKYKNKRDYIITDSSKFPDDFWNYLVNPIVGYHIPKPINKTKKKKKKNKEIE